MHRYKLTIAYDGTNYSGWQIQINAISIQNLIQDALKILCKHPLFLVGAGRTDAGVHAQGQVAHFESDKNFDLFKLQASLNGLLPPDIRVLSVEKVNSDFHARYSALSKEYHYHLHFKPNPFKRFYSYHVLHKVNVSLLQEAAHLFVGEHNFTSFTNQAQMGCAAKNAIRTITRLDVCQEKEGLRLEFEGNGFLYKMVRNITGSLLDVSRGKIKPSEIPRILAEKNRSAAGSIAPAHGLFLKKIVYREIFARDEK